MEIRRERTWCPTCTAWELWPQNLPVARLYLRALDEWRGPDTGRKGFEPAQVLALMQLSGIAQDEQPRIWELLAAMENETKMILAKRRSEASAGQQKAVTKRP